MPGGDRTGPAGMGPMTGRAAGFCAGYAMPGYSNPVGGRGYWGRGSRMGRGRGLGRSFGWSGATGSYPANTFFAPTVTNEQEIKGLKQQAEFLQNSLGQINERIGQLEKEKAK